MLVSSAGDPGANPGDAQMKRNKIYTRDIEVLDSSNLSDFLDAFWKDVMSSFNEEQVISLISKIKYANGQVRSYSKTMKVTNDLKFKGIICNNIESYIDLNFEHYEDLEVRSIFIDYSLSDYPLSHPKWSEIRDILDNKFITMEVKIENNQINDYTFMPLNMDLTSWNNDIEFMNGHRIAFFAYNNLAFKFKVYGDHYIGTITSSGNTLLKFKDTLEHPRLGPTNFTRIFYKPGKDNKWNFEYEKRVYELSELKSLIREKTDSKFLTFKGRAKSKNQVEANNSISLNTIVKLV